MEMVKDRTMFEGVDLVQDYSLIKGKQLQRMEKDSHVVIRRALLR